MRIERRSGGDERRIVTGMIVDDAVLAKLTGVWVKEGHFGNQWANLIGGWCVRHFEKYGTAPRADIEGIFQSWADRKGDKDTVAIVEKFLGGLSEEYDNLSSESNTQYVLDLAGEHFNKVRLRKLAETIEGDIEDGDLEAATKRVHEFGRLEVGGGAGVDVMFDEAAIQHAFESKSEPIIRYPSSLGMFFGDSLERDGFVAFMGPEKRGKSFWLIDVAWRAMCQRRRVAMFQCGDMSQAQTMRRLMVRAARRPLKAKTILYPTLIEHEPNDPIANVDHEERNYDKALDWRYAVKAARAVMERKAKTDQSLFRLSTHAAGTVSVSGIKGILKIWERSGWTPDVVAIDYADILAGPPGVEGRDAIDQTWMGLRALSQQYHCLVVTATQSDAASYKTNLIGREHFTNDKRKLAHVTGMIGLNQTPEEKHMGLIRLNFVGLREDEYSEVKCVHVAGCLGLANPAIISCF